ncbi:MAG: hypothetical protein HQL56_02345 [Magnetococcales bacterium]|nr:hypothetical protein [Magnetococcales bacterium]
MDLFDGWQFTILCEDVRTERAISAFLRTKKVPSRRITPVPRGSIGSGEQFVRTHADAVVKGAVKTDVRRIVIVVMDADKAASQDEYRQIDISVDLSNKKVVLARFIPRRNIETWLAWLKFTDEDIDEANNYKAKINDGDIKSLIGGLPKALRERYNTTPPSLRNAVEEWDRLKERVDKLNSDSRH